MTNDGVRVADAGDYGADAIVIFSGLAAVRRNPSMYVGSTGLDGLHHLAFELVDNAIDEVEAGYCRQITVTLHADGGCSVQDDGRGIPTEIHTESGRPACEVVLTTLHSGGKFRGDSYTTSAGLHGVGLSCVNALSETLRLDVWRSRVHYTQEFAKGEPLGDLTSLGETDQRGTRVTFRPDPEIFELCEFSAAVLRSRLQELAFLHPDVTVELLDERTGEHAKYSFQSGIRGFLTHRSEGAVPVHPEPIVLADVAKDCAVELAVQWTEGYAEEVWSFVNSVRTDQGGTHVDGLRVGLAKAINRYADEHGMLDTFVGERITTVDILEGLTAVVALRLEAPRFDGQTKKRLQNTDIARYVQEVAEKGLWKQIEADEALGSRVVGRVLDATRARLAARLATRTARYQQRELEIDYEVYQRQFGIRSSNWHESCSWLTDEDLLSKHAELCDVPEDARVLDVCCGSGVVGDSFRGRVGEMIGLDITPEMVRLASDRLDRVDQGTVYDMPYPAGSFDLVVNREVLHLLPQPERPLREIYRVLRPGGQFIVGQTMPYGPEDAYWMFRIFKKKQPLLHQMFCEEEFRRLLTDSGFVFEEMTEHFLWESIDLWIDTHETTPAHRQEIYRLFYDAPREVKSIHPFEIDSDGSVRDCWRWCVYSVRKPMA